ncbi:T9SS type A sorting domain-containing protein [Flavobacterium sp. J49]|uniref:T9SS type A sorting domain-containing protein n=1 Tax=Flavobacterium sp. J49 TaxID=2718534 RepID=UPI0015936089|nr:T9SS type A sorting domain-containing protein [Flavobacterium sp. J49]MBF6642105.1 T9SS type A sorting domain-containing protein [Flavobacterium sp. J49]NIC03352.1 T9SS type A sorting domain-containing protein [Flavobacterium sp. J49]
MIKKYLFITLLIHFCAANSQCWQISADGNHCLVFKSDGNLFGWGNSYNGQLATASSSTYAVPTAIGTGSVWNVVSAGQLVTLGIKSNGSMWATGSNQYGQLGNANLSFYQFGFVRIGTANDWNKAFAGTNQCFALKTDGTLWGWGDNSEGELGTGGIAPSYTPIQITTGTDWNYISTGMHHVLALKNNGRLWGWGYNTDGQLGLGTGAMRTTPGPIGSDTWLAISAGYTHSVGIKSNGTLWGTGRNISGELGDGTNTSKNTFVQIGTDTNWQSVSCGAGFSLAIKTDGSLWAWGNNSNGTLGLGNYINVNTPTRVGTASNWQTVNAGVSHSMGLKSDGSIWVWGNNLYNQLGIGAIYTNIPRTAPTRVANTDCQFLEMESFATEIISIYPNPVTDTLNISCDALTLDVIIITDALGKEILNEKNNPRTIDVSHLKSGLYFIQCQSGNNIFTKKFIKS